MKFFRKFLTAVAAFVAASVVMLICEGLNSRIYPFPEGANLQDPQVVQQLAAALPWTAYILVLSGWILGGLVAGYITAKLSHEDRYRTALVVAILLFAAGWSNYLLLHDALWFYIVATPSFFLTTYAGFRLGKR